MKAIVWTKYGSPDGLHLTEVEKPILRDNDVLVKIRAATVTAGDCEVRSLKFPLWLRLPIRLFMGIRNPRNKILGQELAGDVETAGKDVKQFKVGDPIFGTTGLAFGAYAEYIRLPENGVMAIKPTNATYDEAAALPTGGLEALHFMRKANIQSGQKVLIIGAGGSIGSFALQIAKYFGAEVTGVDKPGKLDMLRSIGADHVIDYTQEDFSKSGATYDVIFDVMGKSSFSGSVNALKPDGRYLVGNMGLLNMLRGRWVSMTSRKQVIFGAALQNTEDLLFLKELVEADKLKSVIDRHFPLEQTAEAHAYVDSGQKIGNVVITVS